MYYYKIIVQNPSNKDQWTYKSDTPLDVGAIVAVTVGNKPHTGLVIGPDKTDLPPEKIKSVLTIHPGKLPPQTIEWIKKMSVWTMMPTGSIWKLMSSAADFTKIENRKSKNENRKKKIVSRLSILDSRYHDTGTVVLSPDQAAAANKITVGNFAVTLLDGITGSGKTQVYFDAALRAYDNGKSVLLMMPEIALTAQFSDRFKERFGAKPVIWHSNLTPAKRRDIWHGVLGGQIKMIVGTRSALFLPWQDLGLIVVDEEHDISYKQDEMGNYHARDMAVLYGKLHDIPVILASATPSFETLHNVSLGKYSQIRLTARYGGAMLPIVEIVDLRKRIDSTENTHLQRNGSNGN